MRRFGVGSSNGLAAVFGTAEPYQVGISQDDHIPGLAELTRRVHAEGAKIGMQLQHAGKTATRDMTAGRDLWVPSVPPPPALPGAPRAKLPLLYPSSPPVKSTTVPACWL